jgi:putative lysine transport system substrate-binding protein
MITALTSGAIDGYISERPGAVSACAANANLAFVTPGFVASEEDTSIAVALKQGQPELIEQINGILAGISTDDRNALMDSAVLNQPVSAE